VLPRSRAAALSTLEPFAVELIKLVPELALWLPEVTPTQPLDPEQEKRRLSSTLEVPGHRTPPLLQAPAAIGLEARANGS